MITKNKVYSACRLIYYLMNWIILHNISIIFKDIMWNFILKFIKVKEISNIYILYIYYCVLGLQQIAEYVNSVASGVGASTHE